MPDGDKVISHFQDAIEASGKGNRWRFVRVDIIEDAIELLKEKEPVEAKIMGESKSHGSWWFACGACGHAIDPEDNFCRECGREIKWDD